MSKCFTLSQVITFIQGHQIIGNWPSYFSRVRTGKDTSGVRVVKIEHMKNSEYLSNDDLYQELRHIFKKFGDLPVHIGKRDQLTQKMVKDTGYNSDQFNPVRCLIYIVSQNTVLMSDGYQI